MKIRMLANVHMKRSGCVAPVGSEIELADEAAAVLIGRGLAEQIGEVAAAVVDDAFEIEAAVAAVEAVAPSVPAPAQVSKKKKAKK